MQLVAIVGVRTILSWKPQNVGNGIEDNVEASICVLFHLIIGIRARAGYPSLTVVRRFSDRSIEERRAGSRNPVSKHWATGPRNHQRNSTL